MTKEKALQDVLTVQKMMRKGRHIRSHELRKEQADDLGSLISCLNDETKFIDVGGELLSRKKAVSLLAEVSHYAYERDRYLEFASANLVCIFTSAVLGASPMKIFMVSISQSLGGQCERAKHRRESAK
jgi:hypothetical protein